MIASVLLASPGGASHVTAPQLTSGGYHNCVLMDGDAECWGYEHWGQADPYTGGDAVSIDAGGFHTCVVKTNGNTHCYGENNNRQRWDYTAGDAVQVAGGDSHTCVLTAAGNVDCRGSNANGQSGDYNGGDAVSIGVGEFHSCAVRADGDVRCWGYNGYGGANHYYGRDAVSVAGGRFHTCALLDNGNVECWGRDNYGQATDYRGGDAIAVDTGRYHTCILVANGTIDCFGNNSDGQSRDYTVGDAVAVATGMWHTCALLSSGNVHCWGDGGYGQDHAWVAPDHPPNPPSSVSVKAGPSQDELTVSWSTPPRDEGYGGLDGYQVYRADNLAGPYMPIGNTTQRSLVDAGLELATSYFYRVASLNDTWGPGSLSVVAAGTTFSAGSGVMTIRAPPICTLTGQPGDYLYCNSPRYGYTDVIGTPARPTFNLDWGNFRHHDKVDCEGACSFWMEFDLEVLSPQTDYSNYEGTTFDIARLQRYQGGFWQDIDMIRGQVTIPDDAPWGLNLVARLHGSIDDFGLDQESAAFRLVPENRPGTSEPWGLDLDAAQAQLVAPPTVMVRGWRKAPNLSNYELTASWGNAMESGMRDRAQLVLGQDPWAWYGGDPFTNVRYNAKADFRVSSLRVLDAIFTMRDEPAERGAPFAYDGPVNIVAHSMGGLVSRYLIEDLLPSLEENRRGASLPGPVEDAFTDQAGGTYGKETYDPDELIDGLVTIGTPHYGSGLARVNAKYQDSRVRVASCAQLDCSAYYLSRGGSYLWDHHLFRDSDIERWWRDSVGAYRSWDFYNDDPHLSVMADLELMRIKDGNPILEDLNPRFATQDVRYFLQGGQMLVGGDGIVSTKSSTHNYDNLVCYRLYDNLGVDYSTSSTHRAEHNDLPRGPRVQADALVFLAGNDRGVCQNTPIADGAAGAEAQAAPLDQYEPPLYIDAEADGNSVSVRYQWRAPGGIDASLILRGAQNGTTVTLTAPGGATWTLGSPDESWIQAIAITELGEPATRLDMPGAAAGDWKLEVAGLNEGPMVSHLVLDTTATLDIRSAGRALVAQAYDFVVAPTADGSPIPGATVSVTVGSGSPLSARDDGVAPDETAGDGLYTASHTFDAPGGMGFVVQASWGGATYETSGTVAVMEDLNESRRNCSDLFSDLGDAPTLALEASPTFMAACFLDGPADPSPGALVAAVEDLGGWHLSPPEPPAAAEQAQVTIQVNGTETGPVTLAEPIAGHYLFRVTGIEPDGDGMAIEDWRLEIRPDAATCQDACDPVYAIGNIGAVDDVVQAHDGSSTLLVRVAAASLPQGDTPFIGQVTFHVPSSLGERTYWYDTEPAQGTGVPTQVVFA